MRWRLGIALFFAVAMSAAACSNDGDTQRVVAIRPSSTTTEATTTTTAAPAAPAAPRIQRVRSLPGESAAPRAAKPSRRGPTPTGRIIIPRIGLDHLTYEGLDLAIIDYGPSHWPGTAMPGEVGNPVFPGHRVTHSHPFFDIDLIQIGDHVTFVRDNGRFTYEVTQTFVVNADEVWIADATDTPTFTIFGCHPKHSAKQRYVVKGKLIKSERKTAASASGNAGSADDNYTSGNYEPDHPAPPPPESTTTTAPKSLIPRIGGK